jgi:hypothetical protein
MKTLQLVLVSVALSSFSLVESASAAVAVRRTAIVAQGPGGTTVVAGRRTAIVRPGYGFVASTDTKKVEAADSKRAPCEPHVKPIAVVETAH